MSVQKKRVDLLHPHRFIGYSPLTPHNAVCGLPERGVFSAARLTHVNYINNLSLGSGIRLKVNSTSAAYIHGCIGSLDSGVYAIYIYAFTTIMREQTCEMNYSLNYRDMLFWMKKFDFEIF